MSSTELAYTEKEVIDTVEAMDIIDVLKYVNERVVDQDSLRTAGEYRDTAIELMLEEV